jgi:hypothetical protein
MGSGPGRLFRPANRVATATLDERSILLDLQNERYLGLDEVGTRIWSLVRQGMPRETIIDRLEEEYEATREQLEADVPAFLAELPAAAADAVADTTPAMPREAVAEPTGPAARPPTMLVCGLMLLLADVTLRILGLRRSLVLARRFAGRGRGGEPANARTVVAETARRVAIVAAFYPRRALCLEQSIALHFLLRRRRVTADLRVGVQPFPFAAHAWVEHHGRPVNEREDFVTRLATFPTLGG